MADITTMVPSRAIHFVSRFDKGEGLKKLSAIITSVLLVLVLAGCTTTVGKAVGEEVSLVPEKETPVIIAGERSGVSIQSAEDLLGSGFWKQIVAAQDLKEEALAMTGERNLVVLSSEEQVIVGVRSGLFLIGILPTGSAIPEGCVAVAAK